MVRALERADEFADSFGHDYTGAEHIVLSILADKEAAPTDIAEQLGALGALIYELHQ
jgi:ATP-dependent Clp protease ATP-binding subunit ClpA